MNKIYVRRSRFSIFWGQGPLCRISQCLCNSAKKRSKIQKSKIGAKILHCCAKRAPTSPQRESRRFARLCSRNSRSRFSLNNFENIWSVVQRSDVKLSFVVVVSSCASQSNIFFFLKSTYKLKAFCQIFMFEWLGINHKYLHTWAHILHREIEIILSQLWKSVSSFTVNVDILIWVSQLLIVFTGTHN